MKSTLSIALREIIDRRTVLAAAFVAGLLPLAAPLLPTVGAAGAGDARNAMAGVVAAAFGLLVALLAGASIPWRDLAEGRLAFDFARPTSGLSIWAGRCMAALGLCALATLVGLLPVTLAGGGAVLLGAAAGRLGLVFVAVALALVPLAQVASIAMRSRSPWLAFDLTALLVAAVLASSTLGRLRHAGAFETLLAAQAALVLLAGLALWLASAAGVVLGRSDVRRMHRLQSLVLGPALLLGALSGEAFSRWLVAVGPADLRWAYHLAGAPRGDWIVASGTARGRPRDFTPSFLVDTRGGGYLAAPWWTVFSADGRRAAWADAGQDGSGRLEVVVAGLDVSPPQPRSTSVVIDSLHYVELALSADGSRLAVLEGDRLSAFETDTGRLLAVGRIPEAPAPRDSRWVDFRTDDAVRVYTSGDALQVAELDIAERKLTSVAHMPSAALMLQWTAAHDRLVASVRKGTIFADGLSGREIAHFTGVSGRLLADGRVVLVEKESGRLRLISRDGEELSAFDGPAGLVLGHELAPGVLLGSRFEPGDRRGSLARVDLERGVVEPLGTGFRALHSGRCPEPGSAWARAVNLPEGIGLYDPLREAIGPLFD